jgi:flavin-binding protein dodecin
LELYLNNKEKKMADNIGSGAIKIVEVIGISEKSFENAVEQAVKKASKTIEGINGAEVLKFSVKISDGKISQYRANVKLAFPVK